MTAPESVPRPASARTLRLLTEKLAEEQPRIEDEGLALEWGLAHRAPQGDASKRSR